VIVCLFERMFRLLPVCRPPRSVRQLSRELSDSQWGRL